jgi:hypothetical protein
MDSEPFAAGTASVLAVDGVTAPVVMPYASSLIGHTPSLDGTFI